MKILILVFFFISFELYSQDSTLVSNIKLIEMAEQKRNLERRDSLHTALIGEQDLKIQNLAQLVRRDSIENSLLNLQIASQQKIITVLQPNYKSKWYESKWFYYALGTLTMYMASELVSNVR